MILPSGAGSRLLFSVCLVCAFASARPEVVAADASEAADVSGVFLDADGTVNLGSSPVLLAQAAAEETDSTDGPRAGDPWAGVEEMLVTGSSHSEALLGSPTSVTSFDALELEAAGVKDIGDLSAATPNLSINRSSATTATFFIRGVGLADFGANATSAVAVVQDGVGVNTSPLQLGQIFDAQVDVLRGPRGTGAFRNGSAGAIVINSNLPEFEHAASLRARIGTWAPDVKGAHHGLIQDYEGMLNVPILEDVLSARMAFRIRQAEPYKVNGCGFALPIDQRVPRVGQDPGAASQCGERSLVTFPVRFLPQWDGISPIPEGLPDLFGEEDNWAARGQLLLRPPDTDHELLLNFRGSRLDQQPVVGQAIGTGRYPNGAPPPGSGPASFFGGLINGQGSVFVNYREPDQLRQFTQLCGALVPPAGVCSNPRAPLQLAKTLANDLDERPYRVDVNREGRTRLETFGTSVKSSWQLIDQGFSTLEFGTLTGYDQYKRYEDRDLDYTPETIFESQDDDEAKQVWHEMKLGGSIDTALIDWEVGGFFFWEDLDADLFLILPVSPFSTFDERFFGIQRIYTQKTESAGIWGKSSWEFVDSFTLDTGVRFNYENKSFDFDRVQAGISQPLEQEETFNEWTGHVALEHRFTEDIAFTLRYSRGFKPGTFNGGVNSQQQTAPVDPEFLNSFEGLLDLRALAGRIALRAELFYYLYENYQVFLFSDQPTGPPVLEVQNADSVENYGADIELTLKPLDGWVDSRFEDLRAIFRIGWLESQFIDFTNERLFRNNRGDTIPVTVDFSGNRLPNSPRFSVAGSFDWTFDLGSFGQITPRYDFTFTDDTYFDAEEGRGNIRPNGVNVLPEYTTGQPAYILHNVRLSYETPDGMLEVAGWIRNIEDERYKLYAFDASGFSNLVINTVSDPRTLGVDFKLSY